MYLLAGIAKVSGRAKCLFLNNEPSMARPTLINSLNQCTGSFNVLSPKKCVPKETKDINVKAVHMITNTDEAKAMAEHISFDYKCKFNSRTCNLNQKRNNKTCQCECKNYHKC